jgi:hypothetical protein
MEAASASVSKLQWAILSFPQEVKRLHSLSQEIITENTLSLNFWLAEINVSDMHIDSENFFISFKIF